jgi:hypothetical protein
MLIGTTAEFASALVADPNGSSVPISGGIMVPCTRLLWHKVTKHGSEGWDYRKCAKKSTRYFRVEYASLNYRGAGDKNFDIFALCESCANEATKLGDRFWYPKQKRQTRWGGSHWMSDNPVYGFRGKIASYTEIQGEESTFRNDIKDRHRAHIKASFFRVMRQSCYAKITPEEWKRIFEDLYEEFIVASVLHS